MIKYNEMRKMLDLCGYGKGICSTCMGGNGNCENWNKELGANSMCGHGEYYANKSECEALLKYWDDKEGSVEEWRRNNVPMKKWNEDGLRCESCMGCPRCESWIKECGIIVCCGVAYANKQQTEALLKWHDDRYGSIEQARQDSEKDKKDGPSGCGGNKWVGSQWVDVFNSNSKTMERILNSHLRPKKETPKPFSTLEEFDIKIIKMFIERRKIKFHQLCLGLGLEREDTDRIIAGIK